VTTGACCWSPCSSAAVAGSPACGTVSRADSDGSATLSLASEDTTACALSTLSALTARLDFCDVAACLVVERGFLGFLLMRQPSHPTPIGGRGQPFRAAHTACLAAQYPLECDAGLLESVALDCTQLCGAAQAQIDQLIHLRPWQRLFFGGALELDE
jgi:hypothetical protein